MGRVLVGLCNLLTLTLASCPHPGSTLTFNTHPNSGDFFNGTIFSETPADDNLLKTMELVHQQCNGLSSKQSHLNANAKVKWQHLEMFILSVG
jgi:hypothetical protein